ncbi:Copper-binding protein [Azospirillaceae bacterium]
MILSRLAFALATTLTVLPFAAKAESAAATGVVNHVDAVAHILNLTHSPIPALGWPGMTMDFSVEPSIDLTKLAPGVAVRFTVARTSSGLYLIDSVAREK